MADIAIPVFFMSITWSSALKLPVAFGFCLVSDAAKNSDSRPILQGPGNL